MGRVARSALPLLSCSPRWPPARGWGALPSSLSRLKTGWAFAWRTLIAAELVFGVSSGQGGLGWYVFQNRNELYTDKVFAGLATVSLIGLVVESVVFQTLERLTVRRWGGSGDAGRRRSPAPRRAERSRRTPLRRVTNLSWA